MKRIADSIQYAFAAIGLLVTAFAFHSAWREIAFLARAAPVAGRILPYRGSADAPAFVYEYPAGTYREGHAKNSSTSYRTLAPGEPIGVYVDPADPERAEMRHFLEQWMEPVLVGGLGLLFASIGIGLIAYSRRKAKWKAYLLQRGIKIKAAITGVGIDGSISVNDVSPAVVEASALVDGKVYLYRSEHLWYDPTPYLDREDVDVYYQEGNPARYHMDVSFLPNRGN